jgi:SAM-dependent methyltransferase
MFQFLDLSLMTTGIYQEVLDRVKKGEKFLDLGCCLGQEIRQLVLDGVPSINTYGFDLYDDFFDIGYELFNDRDRLQTTFIVADVFNDASSLSALAGQMNIIYTGAFFHLFNLEEQETIALRIIQLLKPQPGSLIIGRQSGSESPGEYSRSGDKGGRKHFRHNVQTWTELWGRVGRRTESKWSVVADLHRPEYALAGVEGNSTTMRNKMGAKGLRFTIERQ